jgi:hypothetical protein
VNVSHVLGDEYITFEEIDDALWGPHQTTPGIVMSKQSVHPKTPTTG